ncbi:hypothetical protein [Paraburkholderia caribensis]|uniref:hypothetical protein n=1 Tax=Paraburkholderia caribensis TaxID=75105 RepID=UPI001CB3BE43|nr:hypothetical protein [Paraburkholderia caribensis]CAG9263225.1 conserved hypothetical protein [Paraburkholderia caribensis]
MTYSADSDKTISHLALPLGALDQAGNFARFAREAGELRASAPVFVAPIDDALAEHMVGGRAILRMGAIPLPTGGVMITIRLQKKDTQFVWVADATDEEVWHALDAFRKTTQAGFGFVSGENVWFLPYETQDDSSILDRFRSEVGRNDRMFIDAAVWLATEDKSLPQIFESMRADIKVKHRRVCILGTTQVKAALAVLGGVTLPLRSVETLLNGNSSAPAPGAMQ